MRKIDHNEDKACHFFIENIYIYIYVFIILVSVWSSQWVKDKDKRRRRQTAILTHNFFLTTLCYLQNLCLLSRRDVLNYGPRKWGRTLGLLPTVILDLPFRLTAARLSKTDWIFSGSKLKSDRISRGHLHISFHNAHTFPLNHVTASAYLHWCVLCKEMSNWRLGQGPICNSKQGISENKIRHSTTRFHWLTHSNSITVIVTILKQSKESRCLWLTSS